MNNLMHTKIKYILIVIGLLGLIPFGLPLVENSLWVRISTGLNRIDFALFYGTTILCFLSGIFWGLSINVLITNNSNLNYLLPALSIIPFFFAIGAILFFNIKLKIIFLVIGFLICQILDEILFAQKFHLNWYILLRRFLTVVVVTLMICYYILFNNA
tara:strand:+ start:74 stop:547 length:474 start_codon:yes stop_codon:yes gene_type:complete